MSIIEKAMEKAHKDRIEKTTQMQKDVAENTDQDHIISAENSSAVKFSEPEEEKLNEISQQSDNGELSSIQLSSPQKVEINPRPELIMGGDSALLEGGSYRILKEYILALRKSSPEKSLFMVTSPMKGEGKTLVSCNLACALASEYDTTVLLIDVDLRAPKCHEVLGIQNPPKGLSDCLLKNISVSDCLIHTGLGKLSLLCAGTPIDNPAELITSKRMQDFLLEIKDRYPDRIIILDSLPLLPFAESRALSRMTDGVMLVVRENVTYKRHLENALHQLHDIPLLGMVYNAATTLGVDKEIYNLSSYAYGY